MVIQEALDFYVSQTESSMKDLSLIPEDRRTELVTERLRRLSSVLSRAQSVLADIEILLLKN